MLEAGIRPFATICRAGLGSHPSARQCALPSSSFYPAHGLYTDAAHRAGYWVAPVSNYARASESTTGAIVLNKYPLGTGKKHF